MGGKQWNRLLIKCQQKTKVNYERKKKVFVSVVEILDKYKETNKSTTSSSLPRNFLFECQTGTEP